MRVVKTVADKDRPAGFTLLEVAVAVAVLSFALVSILGVVAHNVNLAAMSGNYLRASALADEMASEIQARGVGSVSAESGTFEDHPGFRWNVSIFPYDIPGLGASLNVVTVLITWDEEEQSYEVNFVAGR